MTSRSIELDSRMAHMERVNRASYDNPDRRPTYRDVEDDAYREDTSKPHWSQPFSSERPRKNTIMHNPLFRKLLYLGLVLFIAVVSFRTGRNGAPTSISAVVPDFLQGDLSSSYRHKGSFDEEIPALTTRPSGTKIVGLVFFGRPIFVNILDCYLRKNLKKNGGVLDEIRFILHTQYEEDIKWLEDLVEKDNLKGQYVLLYEEEKLQQEVWANGGAFSYLWGKYATDDDTIYVKIDDDLVWIGDSAIPRMVNSLLAHPEAYSIQANIINSRFTHWFHYTTGAILPFLPDPAKPASPIDWEDMPEVTEWRTSKLPEYPIHTLPEGTDPVLDHYVDARTVNPRWLPLPVNTKNLLRTPFGDGYDLPDPKTGVKNPAPRWALAAQEHLSFLHNLEHKELRRYWFGAADDGLWNTWFQHYNVNFMVFWGKTMASRPFWNESDPDKFLPNDEYALTMDVPRELGMPVLVDSKALVCHFAFHGSHQRDGLLKTELLDRYRLLANDMTCKPNNQKTRLLGSEEDKYEESQGDGTSEPGTEDATLEDGDNSAKYQEGGR